MKHTITLDVLLWCFTGIIFSLMVGFLLMGWLKGLYWERQVKMKNKGLHRYNYR